ncbi:hypothetical protein B7P43_G08618 [Cryptotermes secundus]|uniref:Major facilitator superfamily (MFS) profile domain-containing protein n=1 Tax=Cryptotermes secundus TaxID=105785 RepID=A0A2J7Q618_9NEOP|nr:hypothetical protein B7P43_G08618 [Cryptotermes secundus]
MSFREILLSSVSSATLLSSGINFGFSAVSLPHLQDPDGADRLTVEEGSWFASMGFVSILAGCLTTGPLMDSLGRKRTLLVSNTPFIVGWLLLWTAPKPAPVALLYFARLLNGFGAGMASSPSNIYIAEMVTSSTRCMLVTWPSLAVSVGILLVYAMGFIIQEWRTVAAVAAFVPVITAILIFLCLSESPIWLLARGREDEARKSFEWIRNVDSNGITSIDVQREFQIIMENSRMLRESVKKASQGHADDEPLFRNVAKTYGTGEAVILQAKRKDLCNAVLSTLRRSDVWKPLVILNCYFFFMQFSGVPVLIAYSVNIMMSEGVSLEPYLATVLLGIVKLFFEIVAGFVQNRCGRRPLSIGSGLGMAICMVGLGLYHELTVESDMRQRLAWIPLLVIFLYVVSAAIGFFLIPWAMLGEMYPAKVKGLACGITTFLGNLFGFASIKMFPTFVVLMGGTATNVNLKCTEGVFYLYGGITFVAVLFIYLFLPETFRKTLQEISDSFSKPGIVSLKHL